VERPKVESVRGDEEDKALQEKAEVGPCRPRAMEYKGCDEDGRMRVANVVHTEKVGHDEGPVGGGGEVREQARLDAVVHRA
jgi:hypothetical protein